MDQNYEERLISISLRIEGSNNIFLKIKYNKYIIKYTIKYNKKFYN